GGRGMVPRRPAYGGSHGCARSLALSHTGSGGGGPPDDAGLEPRCRRAMGTRRQTLISRPALLPWIGMGRSPFRTAGNDEQASSVATPAVEGRQRPKKPGPSLL